MRIELVARHRGALRRILSIGMAAALLFTGILPKTGLEPVDNDLLKKLIQSQPISQYYALSSSLPIAVMAKLFNMHLPASASGHQKKGPVKKNNGTAAAASDFSLAASRGGESDGRGTAGSLWLPANVAPDGQRAQGGESLPRGPTRTVAFLLAFLVFIIALRRSSLPAECAVRYMP